MRAQSNFAIAFLLLVAAAIYAETIVTNTGQHFEDAKITSVTPATLTIFHRSGVATVPLWELPPEIRQRYHYNEADARAWLATQAEQQRQKALEVEKARQEEAAAKKRAREKASKNLQLATREEQLRAALTARLLQQRGGRPFSPAEFQFFDKETREAILKFNPEAAPPTLQSEEEAKEAAKDQ